MDKKIIEFNVLSDATVSEGYNLSSKQFRRVGYSSCIIKVNIAFFQIIRFLQFGEVPETDFLNLPPVQIAVKPFIIFSSIIQIRVMVKDIGKLGKQIGNVLILCGSSSFQSYVSESLCQMLKNVKGISTDDNILKVLKCDIFIWFVQVNRQVLYVIKFA